MIDKPGCYNLSMSEYQADPCIEPSLSSHVIQNLVYKSPAFAAANHPRFNKGFEPEEKPEKFDIGQAAHSLVLDGKDLAVLIDGDDWRKKEAREARDKARSMGKIPFLPDQYYKVLAMCKVAEKAIYDCTELRLGTLSQQGDSEVSYIWEEEGTWFRARPDWISEDRKIILDYKTTAQSANPNDVVRQIINFGYDIQNALYLRGARAINGIEPKFVFLFQETIEPYLCSFVALDPLFLELGKSKVDYGIFLWRECLATGKWPGYPDQIAYLECPGWAAATWENRAKEIGGIE